MFKSILVIQHFIGMCLVFVVLTPKVHVRTCMLHITCCDKAWYLPRKTDNSDGTMKVDVEETDYCALAQL